MPRRRQISCQQCRARHMKCNGESPCFNCTNAQKECTQPPKHLFRQEQGTNVGITRHKTAHTFVYDPGQVWVSNSKPVDFVNTSSRKGTIPPKTRNQHYPTQSTPRLIDQSRISDADHSDLAQWTQDRDLDEAFVRLNLQSSGATTPHVRRLVPRPAPTSDLFLQPAANREGLHSAYYRLHPGEADGGLQYFIHAACGSAAMAQVLDATALLYLGTKHNFESLTHQARKQYVIALGSLRREIFEQTASPATLFGIIHIMETFELFSSASSCFVGWKQHACGNVSIMNQVLRSAKETETWDILQRPLSSGTRAPFSLWHGLCQRKRMTAHEKFWSRARDQDNIIKTAMTVPGVLEIADSALNMPKDSEPSIMFNSLARLNSMQAQLHRSLKKWSEERTHLSYTLASHGRFATSLLHQRDIIALSVMSYRFHDLASATTHLAYWLCLLLTTISRLDGVTALAKTDEAFRSEVQERRDEANEYASNICRSLAYCTLDEHGFVGLINVVGPFAFVAKWYVREQNEAQIQWCRSVESRLRTTGLQSPFGVNASSRFES